MDKIKLTANSKTFEVEMGSTLESFARSLGLNPDKCVAEVNGEPFGAAEFGGVKLSEGDVIEIMQIVAGG